MNSDCIKENIHEIRNRIARAVAKSGRKPEDIKIIAVTKTVEPEKIVKALDENILDIGENRVQELCEKYDIIKRGCNWHLIGHLQTNKVKYIIDKVSLIHSVDSIELAQEINKRAERIGKVMDVLVQVNVAGEDTKFGITPKTAPDFVKTLKQFKTLRVRGLMTIAPYTEEPEQTRYVFKQLRQIFIDINKENTDNIYMDYLSMGMSNDFEVAIEEGANIVRIGTAIFGERLYTI